MKLGEILYETDYDAIRDQSDSKFIDRKSNDEADNQVFEVDFELFDEAGDEVSTTAEADAIPDMVEIEVTGIESFDNNPNPKHEDEEDIEFDYENAEATLTSSAEKTLKKWLKTRSDYVEITDYEFDIDYKAQSGTITAIAVKDDMDVGQK